MKDEQKNKLEGFLEKLQNTYRLVVLNEETFEEVSSYRLTRLNLYVWITVFFTVCCAIVTLLILFTPLKEYIPGYGDEKTKQTVYQLNKKINVLEEDLNAKEKYISSIRTIILGEYIPESHGKDEITEGDSSLNDQPIDEEYELREEVEKRSKFNLITPGVKSSEEDNIERFFIKAPVTGTISAEFDPISEHLGIDIVAPKNTAIQSVLDGMVIFSDYSVETGHTLGIQHSNNLISFYKHNSVLLKKIGNLVKAGEAVAIIGNTGELTDGPHLHFELWHDGQPVNPRNYINF